MFIVILNNISAISWRLVLLVGQVRVPAENHQTLSHNVVSSRPYHVWETNSQF